MWTVVPLDELDSWDGRCLWKIKDGSRRCKRTIGSDTSFGRIGNRDELLAKVSSGGTLMRQETVDLASGLCCLQSHSREHIAQQICEMWMRKLEDNKASHKQYHDSLAATIPPAKDQVDTEGMKKLLGNDRHADEILADENESPTAPLDFPRTTAVPKTSASMPTTKSRTLPSTPERRTAYSKFDTPTNKKMVDALTSQDSGYFSSSAIPNPTLSAKKAYSASPVRRRSSNSSFSVDDLMLFKDENEARNEAVDLAYELAGPTTLFSATPIFNSETANFPFADPPTALKPIDFFAPYSQTVTLLDTIKRDLLQTEIDWRTVYGFRTNPSIPFIKIGMTKNFERRMVEHLSCGIVNKRTVFRGDCWHGKRVEALIHRHLAKERRIEYVDRTYAVCEHRRHIEWFDVSDERFKVVAEGWQKWIALSPYEETNSTWTLKNEWREKLNLVKNNHEEQDVWLDWLNCVVPEFACNPSAHLRHILPPNTDQSENCVIDKEAEPEVNLKAEVKEEPALQRNLPSATALPSITTSPSPLAQQPPCSALATLYGIEEVSSYSPQLFAQLSTMAEECQSPHLSVHAVPAGKHPEKLLISKFLAFTLLCFLGTLTPTQFLGAVAWGWFVFWAQPFDGKLAQVMKDYCLCQIEAVEGALRKKKRGAMATYPIPVVAGA